MSPDGQPEADRLLAQLNDSHDGLTRLRERAWICNILSRRYRMDGLPEMAIAVAQEAITIGEQLGDKNIVAVNRIGLGNALRDKQDLQAALDAFKQGGCEAQVLNRREMEALSSRLAADVLIQMAHDDNSQQRSTLFTEAKNFSEHAIGLMRDSIAKIHWAEALDTYGDALSGLENEAEANRAYAQAARMFLNISPSRSISIIRHLAIQTDAAKPVVSLKVLLSSLSETSADSNDDAFSTLINLIRQTIRIAPPRSIGYIIAAAIRLLRPAMAEDQEFGLWLRLLI